jgi:hypothetical protein
MMGRRGQHVADGRTTETTEACTAPAANGHASPAATPLVGELESTQVLLDAARAGLAAIEVQVATLTQRRHDELLAGADDATVDKTDHEIAEQGRLASRSRDRISVLEARVREIEADIAKAERLARIEKAEAAHEARLQAGRKLAEAIAAACQCHAEVLRLSGKIYQLWPLPIHDCQATLLHRDSIIRLVESELFRQSATGFAGNNLTNGAAVFPGAKPAALQLYGQPDKVEPLVDAMMRASAFASKIMRQGVSSADSEPVPAPTPAPAVAQAVPDAEPARAPGSTNGLAAPHRDASRPPDLTAPMRRGPAAERMAELSREQLRLGMSSNPADEARYMAVVEEIAALQSEVEMELATGVTAGLPRAGPAAAPDEQSDAAAARLAKFQAEVLSKIQSQQQGTAA